MNQESTGGNMFGGFNKMNAKKSPLHQFEDPNNQMSEDERDSAWKKFWKLPKKYSEQREYHIEISGNSTIKERTSGIITGVEKISNEYNMDKQYWTKNEFK